jgi:LacI family transcriptional regulator
MKQIPGMVLINRILPGYETRCVALDDRYGAWLATPFIRLGKRDQPVVARQAALLQRRVVPLQAIFRIRAMAAGAMGVLNDNGIDVPREISLIGFDDVLISRYVRPRLTLYRYDLSPSCGATTE